MTEEKPTAAPGRVSKSTAERILAAAAHFDAVGNDMIDLRELRTAAEDAGISGQSFEMSVAEYRRENSPTSQKPRTVSRRFSYAKVVGVGSLGMAGAIAVVAQLPSPDVGLPAAILAGIGSIGAVIAYLRVALRSDSSDNE
jgi:hypothetical protein